LYVNGENLTDENLALLHTFQDLQFLHVSSSAANVSQMAVNALNEALPGCVVDFVSPKPL
jgi:hypothetical protein